MAAAWFSGPAPGLFAVLLSTLAVDFFLVPPFYSLAINTTDLTYLIAFVLCAAAASWISAVRKKREESLIEAHDQLQVGVAERTAQLEAIASRARGKRTPKPPVLTEVIPQQFLGGTANGSGEPTAAASLQDVLAEVVGFSGVRGEVRFLPRLYPRGGRTRSARVERPAP